MQHFSLSLIKQKKIEDEAFHKSMLVRYGSRIRPLYPFIHNGTVGIIAEIKKASPSKGTIKHVDASHQAALYQKNGASAISVLTDRHYFNGSFDDLNEVASSVNCAVLCKDFICTDIQIELAFNTGADMVLLINAMLSKDELNTLYYHIKEKGMLPLVEVHTPFELERVCELQPKYLMVNMRNLNTLEIDFTTGIETLKQIPPSIQKICASGITHPSLLKHIKDTTDTTIFLVGTALMQAENPENLLQELCNVC